MINYFFTNRIFANNTEMQPKDKYLFGAANAGRFVPFPKELQR
jgi:hypothetical protein